MSSQTLQNYDPLFASLSRAIVGAQQSACLLKVPENKGVLESSI